MNKTIYILMIVISTIFTPCFAMATDKSTSNEKLTTTEIPSIIETTTPNKTLMTTKKNRDLFISGYKVNEQEFGGCERWYAVDRFNIFGDDGEEDKIRLQVGYFKDNNIGFILYEDGTAGEEVHFSREGLDLRWDWGYDVNDDSSWYRYSFIIDPSGTGLYYDFSTSKDGTASPRRFYKCTKF